MKASTERSTLILAGELKIESSHVMAKFTTLAPETALFTAFLSRGLETVNFSEKQKFNSDFPMVFDHVSPTLACIPIANYNTRVKTIF